MEGLPDGWRRTAPSARRARARRRRRSCLTSPITRLQPIAPPSPSTPLIVSRSPHTAHAVHRTPHTAHRTANLTLVRTFHRAPCAGSSTYPFHITFCNAFARSSLIPSSLPRPLPHPTLPQSSSHRRLPNLLQQLPSPRQTPRPSRRRRCQCRTTRRRQWRCQRRWPKRWQLRWPSRRQ